MDAAERGPYAGVETGGTASYGGNTSWWIRRGRALGTGRTGRTGTGGAAAGGAGAAGVRAGWLRGGAGRVRGGRVGGDRSGDRPADYRAGKRSHGAARGLDLPGSAAVG